MFRTVAILLFVACVLVLLGPTVVAAAKRLMRSHERLADKVEDKTDPPTC